jgi:hypothetical protein
MQLVLCNYTNLQLHVSHTIEFLLQNQKNLVMKERTTPKFVLLPTLGLGSKHTHTHTQLGLITVQDLQQVMQPHIHLLSLYMGFKVNIWVVHSCVFLSL